MPPAPATCGRAARDFHARVCEMSPTMRRADSACPTPCRFRVRAGSFRPPMPCPRSPRLIRPRAGWAPGGESVRTMEQPLPEVAAGLPRQGRPRDRGRHRAGSRASASSLPGWAATSPSATSNLPGRDVTEQALLTETALTAMGVRVYAAACDVRDGVAVDRFIGEIRARLGGRCTSSSTTPASPMDGALWRMSDDAWHEVLDTNVTGAFNCIRPSRRSSASSTTARS